MHALGFFSLPLAHVYYVLLCGQVRNFSFGLPHLSGRSYRPSHSCIHAHQILKNMLRGGCVLDLFGNCCGEQDANTTNKQNEKKKEVNVKGYSVLHTIRNAQGDFHLLVIQFSRQLIYVLIANFTRVPHAAEKLFFRNHESGCAAHCLSPSTLSSGIVSAAADLRIFCRR